MNNTNISYIIVNNYNESSASSIGGIEFVLRNKSIILPYILLNFISSVLGVLGSCVKIFKNLINLDVRSF